MNLGDDDDDGRKKERKKERRDRFEMKSRKKPLRKLDGVKRTVRSRM